MCALTLRTKMRAIHTMLFLPHNYYKIYTSHRRAERAWWAPPGAATTEIIGLILEYKAKYTDLNVFVTGGDAHYFDLAQKNVIFADENLTLKGILEIYLLNV